MSQAAVAANVNEPADVLVVLPAQVAFGDVVLVNDDADAVNLLFGEFVHARGHIHIQVGLAHDFDGFGGANPVDAAQCDVGALAVGYVNSGDANHSDAPVSGCCDAAGGPGRFTGPVSPGAGRVCC